MHIVSITQELGTRALVALRNLGLRKGLNGWAGYADERAEMLNCLAEAAGTFRNLALSKGWNSWRTLLDR